MLRRVLLLSLMVIPATLTSAGAAPAAPASSVRAAPPAKRPAKKPRAVVAPPIAKKVPVKTSINGHDLVDDYAWLHDKSNPEVLAYLRAENAYTEAALAPTVPLRERLEKEMRGRVVEELTDVPVRDGGYAYAWRSVKGKPFRNWVRWKLGADGAVTGEPRLVLDVNQLAEGKPVAIVEEHAVSRDGRLLAYSIDHTGGQDYELSIKDLDTGAIVDGPIQQVSSFAWAADGKHIFYTTMDAAKRSDRIWLREIGTRGVDKLILTEKDGRFDVGVRGSKDGAWVLFEAESKTTSETWMIPAGKPAAAPRSVAGRRDGVRFVVAPRGDTLFVRSDEDGRTGTVYAAPIAEPQRAHWKRLVPSRPDVNIDEIDVTRDALIVVERNQGRPQLRFISLDGTSREVTFPEASYSLEPERGRELDLNVDYDARSYRVEYTSLTTPRQTLDLDTHTLERKVREDLAVPGYDHRRYVSERITAKAADGTLVPVSLVHKKGIKLDGKNPLLLYGYGAYGITVDPSFDANRVSLLDRGVIYAMAHVRGGGDLGKPWHDAGRMLNKRNTFTDFIAVAETLIARKYTSPQKLGIYGRSAGGLLIGAVVTMRPELFKVALPEVPFVDVITSMLDESLPLTIGEFEEWGNPKKKEELEYMLSYSPYDNIKKTAYPAMLVRTGLNDSQVLFREPAKFVAKLRASKTDENPLLLVVNMDAGHVGASDRYQAIRERAHDWAFLLTQLGITK